MIKLLVAGVVVVAGIAYLGGCSQESRDEALSRLNKAGRPLNGEVRPDDAAHDVPNIVREQQRQEGSLSRIFAASCLCAGKGWTNCARRLPHGAPVDLLSGRRRDERRPHRRARARDLAQTQRHVPRSHRVLRIERKQNG